MNKKVHYVNNPEFVKHLIEHKKLCRKAKKLGLDSPPPGNYIGECLLKIATNLATKSNFASYPFKDEMIGDAIENCIRYLHNFNVKTSNNAFAYFTQITYYAFLRRIESEKKALYGKAKWLERQNINGGQVADISGSPGYEFGHLNVEAEMGSDYTQEYMENVVKQYEEKKEKTKKASKRVAKKAAKKKKSR